MRHNFQGRTLYRRPILAVLLIVVLLITGFFLLKSVWGLYEKNRLALGERESSLKEWQGLTLRREQLVAKLGALETDRGVEVVLREKFAVARPGERVVNIVDDTSMVVATSSATTFWQKLWRQVQFWRD